MILMAIFHSTIKKNCSSDVTMKMREAIIPFPRLLLETRQLTALRDAAVIYFLFWGGGGGGRVRQIEGRLY